MDLKLMKTRNVYFIFSTFMILFSLFSIFTKGFNLGIDFTGGNIYQMKFEKPVSKEAMDKTLKEMASVSRYFFEEFESFDEAAVKKHFKAAAIEPLEKVKEKLTALSSWDLHSTHEAIEQTAAELEVGMGKVGMPLRVAVTGSGQSPSMDVTLVGIGRERVLARIQRAIDFIKSQNA